MKTPRLVPLSLPALVATLAVTLLTPHTIRAADIEKADNTTALNLAGSYTAGGPPGTSDRILITSAMAANRSVALGGDLSIDGIFFNATASRILTITGSNTLTLGASGIGLSSAGSGLVFNGPAILLGAAQTWDLGARGLTFNGATTLDDDGNAFNISTTGGQIYFHNNTPMTLNASISGSASLTLDHTTAMSLTLTNAASTFTGTTAISTNNTLTASSMNTGGGASSVGTGQIQVKGGTFKYSGNTATSNQNLVIDSRFLNRVEVTTAGQTLTLSNFKNTNSANSVSGNGALLGGAGNLTISNIIADSTHVTRTGTVITKFGTGTLTFTAANTYTGATIINEGTLALGASGSIHANSAITVAAGAIFDASARTSYTFSTATTTTIGVGATSAGQIKAAAATFSSADLAFDFGAASTLLSSYAVLEVSGIETGNFDTVIATGTSISGSFVNAGSGNWTLTAGGYDLTFSESLGTLTAVSSVPEPSTYAAIFGSVALVGAAIRRRRAKKTA